MIDQARSIKLKFLQRGNFRLFKAREGRGRGALPAASNSQEVDKLSEYLKESSLVGPLKAKAFVLFMEDGFYNNEINSAKGQLD